MDNFLDKLNDIEIDLTEYEDIEVTDIEKRNYKKRVFKKIANKSNMSKKVTKAAVILAVILLSPTLIKVVPAAVKLVNKTIENLGYADDKDLTEYKDIINKSETNGEYTVQINELMFDADGLVVSTTIKKNEGELPIIKQEGFEDRRDTSMMLYNVKFNGIDISHAGMVENSDVTSTGYNSLVKKLYDKDIDFSGDGELELFFTNRTQQNMDSKDITFKFKVNVDKMKKEIVSINANKDIYVDGEKLLTIDKATVSLSKLTIYSTLQKNDIYDVSFKIKNDSGEYYDVSNPSTFLENNTLLDIQYQLPLDNSEKLIIIPVIKNNQSGKSIDLDEESIEIPLNK